MEEGAQVGPLSQISRYQIGPHRWPLRYGPEVVKHVVTMVVTLLTAFDIEESCPVDSLSDSFRSASIKKQTTLSDYELVIYVEGCV